MITGLVVVVVIDTAQKRRNYLKLNK